MSYYEYVFNIAYLAPPRLLIKLEEWIDKNPDCKEYVFIGGSSNYEKQRSRYFNIRGS